jgi:hypothetical protein
MDAMGASPPLKFTPSWGDASRRRSPPSNTPHAPSGPPRRVRYPVERKHARTGGVTPVRSPSRLVVHPHIPGSWSRHSESAGLPRPSHGSPADSPGGEHRRCIEGDLNAPEFLILAETCNRAVTRPERRFSTAVGGRKQPKFGVECGGHHQQPSQGAGLSEPRSARTTARSARSRARW